MLAEEISEQIMIPEDVTVTVDNRYFKAEGPKGTLERNFKYPSIRMSSDDSHITLFVDFPKKVDKAALFTVKSHINNMIYGVVEGYCYKLKAVYAHFPLNIKVQKDEVIIDNYLGEKYPRTAKIFGDVKVTLSGDTLTVEGINKEHVGQTAGNLEKATRVTKRDPRVFQDGIYLVERNGVALRW